MKFRSTRTSAKLYTLRETILESLCPDGGLFIPQSLPRFEEKDYLGRTRLTEFAELVLTPFFEGDPLAPLLPKLIQESLNFEIPVRALSPTLFSLELFHGPTAAFKDVGARFLASYLSALDVSAKKTILVATSGDTGGAVAAAFFKKSVPVVVLFPKGKISARQQKGLTTWGENVRALAVEGDFDDCQRLVKEAFHSPAFRKFGLLSANSINLGRLLPQQTYYAYASVQIWRQTKKPAVFVIPTGNLGNALSCLYAKRMGFPIGDIWLSLNANRTLERLKTTGEFRVDPTLPTLANAMDVSQPSNLERVRASFAADYKSVVSVSDRQIRDAIAAAYREFKYALCPHTATAFHTWSEYLRSEIVCFAATAHPAKFDTIVEPILKMTLNCPSGLAAQLSKKEVFDTVAPTFGAFLQKMQTIRFIG